MMIGGQQQVVVKAGTAGIPGEEQTEQALYLLHKESNVA